MKVAPKRWRLEINFSQDAVLMLSSMNLPDGIQVSSAFSAIKFFSDTFGLWCLMVWYTLESILTRMSIIIMIRIGKNPCS